MTDLFGATWAQTHILCILQFSTLQRPSAIADYSATSVTVTWSNTVAIVKALFVLLHTVYTSYIRQQKAAGICWLPPELCITMEQVNRGIDIQRGE